RSTRDWSSDVCSSDLVLRRAEGRALRRLALAPIFVVGFFAGAWLVVSPWVVGFPPGGHGDWSASRWSAVWAGIIVLGTSGAALRSEERRVGKGGSGGM